MIQAAIAPPCLTSREGRVLLREQAIVLRKMGWTQRAIADHIGVPRRTISDWLSHNRKGTFLTFPKFKVGDKVQVNGLCPKYILKKIRHNRVRTVVGVFRRLLTDFTKYGK